MSARLIALAEAAVASAPLGQTGATVPGPMLVREAVSLLGWGTMTYRCDACAFEWDVWLSLGVEGPDELREHGLYVASPFALSSCPAWPVKADATAEERAQFRDMAPCPGPMTHTDFNGDREFPPMLIPDDVPRFVLDHWHESADLVIPIVALTNARRFHAEAEERG